MKQGNWRKNLCLSLVTAFAVTVGLVYPSATYAETTDQTGALHLSKTVTLENDGTYTINLESYATGQVKDNKQKQPLDIILVLDQSGSMSFDFSGKTTNREANTRQYAMKNAVKNFVDSVYKDSTELNGQTGDVEHNIGIITFESSSSVKQALISVENNRNQINNIVNRLPKKPSGATRADLGMKNAYEMAKVNKNRETVVVLFTDGEPTKKDTFEDDVAKDGINYAYQLKNTKNAKVYTVGIFNDASPEFIGKVGDKWNGLNSYTDANKANRFMNLVSSNSKTASSLGLGKPNFFNVYHVATNFDYENKGYYKTASNASDLNAVFSEIQTQTSSPSTDLDGDSVLRDVLTDGFTLTENSKISVNTADYKGNGEWSPANEDASMTVKVSDDKKTVDVDGFDYSSEGNYVIDEHGTVPTSGKKLIVTITGVLPTTNVTTNEVINTNTEMSGVYATATSSSPVAKFEQPTTILDEESYVLDYGKSVELTSKIKQNITGIADNFKKIVDTDKHVNATYGNVSLEEKLTYSPKTTNWNGVDTFYAFGKNAKAETVQGATANTNGNLWSKVNVIPASNVYYEDDFIESTEEDKTGKVGITYLGNWTTTDGTASVSVQSDENIVYGADASYNLDNAYTNGVARQSTASGAKAIFNFTGTGVDIYSSTNSSAAYVYAFLYEVKDGKDTLKKYAVVDNYSDKGTYYAVPTVTFEGLEKGEYKVVLQVVAKSSEAVNYVLDGIRVYNPLGTVSDTNTAEGKAYAEAGELNAAYTEIRSLLLDGSAVKDGDVLNGALYIDQTADSEYNISTYINDGPKHEVYLEKGNGVAFKLTNFGEGDAVYVGVKSAMGNTGEVLATNGNGAKASIPITSTADQYYKITPDADGNVVIVNNGTAVISLTKVRTTSTNGNEIDFETLSTDALNNFVTATTNGYYTEVVDTSSDSEDTSDSKEISDGENAGSVEIDQSDSAEENSQDTNTQQNQFKLIINRFLGWIRGRR